MRLRGRGLWLLDIRYTIYVQEQVEVQDVLDVHEKYEWDLIVSFIEDTMITKQINRFCSCVIPNGMNLVVYGHGMSLMYGRRRQFVVPF